MVTVVQEPELHVPNGLTKHESFGLEWSTEVLLTILLLPVKFAAFLASVD